MPPKDLRKRETKLAMKQDLEDARGWAQQDWDPLTQQRLAAAAQGESSPWLGIKQWATEIPMNMNMRGSDAYANEAIDEREAKFQAEMERLRNLADQKEAGKYDGPIIPKNIWSGVR